jgi:cysteine desulfurase/selenocysteine lyase
MKAASPAVDSRTRSGNFDVMRLREDFPILKQKVHGKPLVYLDNGATGQKPQSVIDALEHYYKAENSNIHRGVHHLSERTKKLSTFAAPPKASI